MVMKNAKRNADCKMKLVRDKLFINNTEYLPDETRSKDHLAYKSRGPLTLENRSYREKSQRIPEVSRFKVKKKAKIRN